MYRKIQNIYLFLCLCMCVCVQTELLCVVIRKKERKKVETKLVRINYLICILFVYMFTHVYVYEIFVSQSWIGWIKKKLLRSPLLGRNDHPMLAGFPCWSSFSWIMISTIEIFKASTKPFLTFNNCLKHCFRISLLLVFFWQIDRS